MQTIAEQKPPLPSPADRPQADVVIYDGNCGICTTQVRRLAGFDGGARLAYFSLHDEEVYRRYPDLTHDALMRAMVVVDRQGNRHIGAAAIRYLSRRLPRLWWLAPLMYLPFSMPLWRRLYRIVADRRYELSARSGQCADGACAVHRSK